MVERLDGKVAVVTGGNSGIGEGIVRRLAAEGAAVAIWARREPEGQAVADAVRAAGGATTFIRCDVTDRALIEAALAQTVARYGGLHILVNNAALLASPHGLTNPDEAAWEAMLRASLTSVYLVTALCWPHLCAAGGATVVNLSSTQAVAATPQPIIALTPRGSGELGNPAYGVAKAGVEALTRYTASAGAPHGVRANCVRPGQILTPRLAQAYGHHPLVRAMEVLQLIDGPGSPEDVAGAVAYLASDDARFVTGQVLNVDGGLIAKVQ
jgi:NAD(P)-dependent dehydrogenase (short-subunit alcohol dehydrogenase family)